MNDIFFGYFRGPNILNLLLRFFFLVSFGFFKVGSIENFRIEKICRYWCVHFPVRTSETSPSSCSRSQWHFYRDAPHYNGSGPSPTISLDGKFVSAQPPPPVSPCTVNGLYGYERVAQSPVNNFSRFPPSLVVTDPSHQGSPYDCDGSHDPMLDQQVSAANGCLLYASTHTYTSILARGLFDSAGTPLFL